VSQTGIRLKALRRERNLTQERLARDANISVTTVARIEAGRHNPGIATALKLARALEVPISALFDGDTDDDAEPAARPA
jgi:transcriptional regulator with XRE-family HTH domain